jgi:U6 snRNA phosphodiesterase
MYSPRKLPALASQLVLPVPIDNPALHQGRMRISPHVEGQFAAYVYVPLQIPRKSIFDGFLDQVMRRSKEDVPIIHPIGGIHDINVAERELHVSLTRPIYLRAHQREEFRTAVRAIARSRNT